MTEKTPGSSSPSLVDSSPRREDMRIDNVCVRGSGKRSIFKPCLVQGTDIVAEFVGHSDSGGRITEGDRKRAAFIVKACNAYERDQEVIRDFIEVGKEMIRIHDGWDDGSGRHVKACEALKCVVAKAASDNLP